MVPGFRFDGEGRSVPRLTERFFFDCNQTHSDREEASTGATCLTDILNGLERFETFSHLGREKAIALLAAEVGRTQAELWRIRAIYLGGAS